VCSSLFVCVVRYGVASRAQGAYMVYGQDVILAHLYSMTNLRHFLSVFGN